MEKYAVIVAGGSGTRMGGGMPKQFRSLKGKPVLWWSMKAFHDDDPKTKIILVLPGDFISLWNDFFSSLPQSDRFPHDVATGGGTRTESVKNGLALIPDKNHATEDSLVAVHDGARPLVSPETIDKGWATAEKFAAAIPVVAVTDSLRSIKHSPSKAVDRDEFKAVQTPQVFRTSLLKEAYSKTGEGVFSDDATVVENMGIPVALFEGRHDNIKITNPKDLAVAEVLMGG